MLSTDSTLSEKSKKFSSPSPLLEQIRATLRTKHYSPRTERTYIYWVKRYIYFHDKRHPNTLGSKDIERFLTHLALRERVAASTQNQAFCALLFLYRFVLHIELDEGIKALRARRPEHLPVVLTQEEVFRIIDRRSCSMAAVCASMSVCLSG